MKSLVDLEENDCRYPMNDGGPFIFCAEAKIEGSNYCSFHKTLCIQRVYEGSGRDNDAYAAILRKNNRPAVITLAEETI